MFLPILTLYSNNDATVLRSMDHQPCSERKSQTIFEYLGSWVMHGGHRPLKRWLYAFFKPAVVGEKQAFPWNILVQVVSEKFATFFYEQG